MDFTKISKLTLLFEMRFCTRVPGKFLILAPMPLVCVNLPGKKERDAIGSSAMEGGGSSYVGPLSINGWRKYVL
jgi:hypothetical protein